MRGGDEDNRQQQPCPRTFNRLFHPFEHCQDDYKKNQKGNDKIHDREPPGENPHSPFLIPAAFSPKRKALRRESFVALSKLPFNSPSSTLWRRIGRGYKRNMIEYVHDEAMAINLVMNVGGA